MSDVGYRGGYRPFFKAVAELSARGVFNSSEVSVEVLKTGGKEAPTSSDSQISLDYFKRDEMEIPFKQGSYKGAHLHKLSNDIAVVAFSQDEEVYSEKFKFNGVIPDSGGMSLSVFIMTEIGVGIYVGQLEEKETREIEYYYGLVFRSDFPDNRCPICHTKTEESRQGESELPNNIESGSTPSVVEEPQDGGLPRRSGFRFRNIGRKDFRRSNVESSGPRDGTQRRVGLFRSFRKN